MLELRALGSAEIKTDVTTLTPSQEIVFASALYLLLERSRRTSRSGLAELLWPSVEASVRSHRLRQTLLQLKKLGFPVLADRDRIGLSTGEVRIDVDLVKVGETGFTHEQSLEFLPGYSPLFSEPFRDWVDGKRSEVNSICSRLLLNSLGAERDRAHWVTVEEIARKILLLDPYNESAVLALAEASAMRGQKHQAVTMLDDYLREVGGGTDIRLPTTLLRKRILGSNLKSSASPLPEPAFVGRDAEVQRLTCRLKEAQEGRGGACLMIGEPGIGKSRLAAELAKFAALQGIRTATVSCQRSTVDRPLSVLIDLAPSLRDMPGALGCSQETLIALRRLTEFDTRGAELSVATAESQALHRALRHALFDLLDAITDEGSLLLIFDDIQWIDRTSADILAGMIEWARDKRLLLIVNSRTTGVGSMEMLVNSKTDLIRLNALTDSAADVLLSSIIREGTPISANDADWIVQVGEGNPFFLQELAKHWLESGGSTEAPPSVNKVLGDRLSRLNPISLQVLQACTILGQSSTVERVEGVMELASHELLSAVQELSAAGMVSSPSDSAEITPLSLRTRHDLLASAVLDGLSSTSRAIFHRRAGITLEKEILGDRMSTALLWACAFHWHHAGNRDRALSVVRSCSEHLLEVGLPDAASEVLDRALEYCTTDEQRMSVLARQVDALQMAGRWERSKQVLTLCRELRARITRTDDQHDSFEIMLFDASYRSSLNVLALLDETILCVECEDAGTSHRLQAAAIALKIASDVDPFVLDSVYRQVEPLLATVEANDPTRIEVEMIYHSIRGDGPRGVAAARTLTGFARKSKDPIRLTRALANASQSYRINGTQADAENCLYEAIDCSRKHHLIERTAIAMQSLVKLRLSTGDIAAARAILEQLKALVAASENLVTTTEQHVLEARVALKEGNPALAAAEFSQVLPASFECSPSRRGAYLALEIQIRLAQGASPDSLRPLTSELEKIHTTLWVMGLQDAEAESLFLALDATGENARGRVLLMEYLGKHRRERKPPAPSLAALCAEGSRAFLPEAKAGLQSF